MALRILHPWNQSAGRCGIANFAEQWSTAMRHAGCEVTDWNADYSTIYRRREAGEPSYMPADAAEYDAILFGWHPGALNYYIADHFPLGPKLAVYLHDIPPWSRCPFEDRADLLITSEPHPERKTYLMPYPVIDWVTDLPPVHREFTVGWTGVRGDGLRELSHLCIRQGWRTNFSDPGHWLSIEDEVRRLATSTVNVCWYADARGLSGASSTCLASLRPLLINRSPMLRHLRNTGRQVVTAHESHSLESALLVLKGLWDHLESPPNYHDVAERFAWRHAAARLVDLLQ